MHTYMRTYIHADRKNRQTERQADTKSKYILTDIHAHIRIYIHTYRQT